MAIKDPVSGQMIYDANKIKTASLNYCKNLLKDKKPDDEFKLDIKVKELLHDVRMAEIVEEDENEEFTIEVFTQMMEKLKRSLRKSTNIFSRQESQ